MAAHGLGSIANFWLSRETTTAEEIVIFSRLWKLKGPEISVALAESVIYRSSRSVEQFHFSVSDGQRFDRQNRVPTEIRWFETPSAIQCELCF